MARKRKGELASFKWQPFSKQQLRLLSWWTKDSPYRDYDMIIADGSIRSGKTVSMIDSFLMFTISNFVNESFIIAGKSMSAIKRNLLQPMFQILNSKAIPYYYNRSENFVEIGSNTYYLFGASTEASQDVLQGMTSAGALLDEVALLPRSFVEQAIARCSVAGSKVFMSCNPESPYHYIKTEYIDKAYEKRILHLKFTLLDNPSLSQSVIDKYKRMYAGVFYDRYILGKWAMAEGIVYSAFNKNTMVVDEIPDIKKWYVGVDYGTSNATVFILAGLGWDNKLYIVDEYYHSGRESVQKTPAQYGKDFVNWIASKKDNNGFPIRPDYIWIDPAANHFKVTLSHEGVKRLVGANNDVLGGIGLASSIMSSDHMRVHRSCKNVLKELGSYAWDSKAQAIGEDRPLKVNDHTLDAIRYIINGTKQHWSRLQIYSSVSEVA